ncbi:MAG: hypothetical protein IPJ82_06405 [Lewinellaceae bacterium]|nr:hypothetical protein [Lewinellaceae bacterium]
MHYFVRNSRIVDDDIGKAVGSSIIFDLYTYTMSDFFKKFKSVFVQEEEGGEGQGNNPQTTSQHPAEMTSPPVARKAPETAVTAGAGAVSDKFVEILLGALEKNNQEGFDYLEFRQALKNLSKMPMDEPTRFHSAYAMAQTMGITPAKLTDSAQFYLNVLTTEQAKFNEAHAQQRSRLIGNREEEVKNLEAMIQQKAEQIKQLTQQIEEHRKQSEQIRREVADSTVKIENTKADFEATFQSISGQIREDIGKIQQHLK